MLIQIEILTEKARQGITDRMQGSQERILEMAMPFFQQIMEMFATKGRAERRLLHPCGRCGGYFQALSDEGFCPSCAMDPNERAIKKNWQDHFDTIRRRPGDADPAPRCTVCGDPVGHPGMCRRCTIRRAEKGIPNIQGHGPILAMSACPICGASMSPDSQHSICDGCRLPIAG